MKDADLKKLLEQERNSRAIKPSKTIPSNIRSSIPYKGISDEDLMKIVIPKIVDLEISGQISKETLNEFIKNNTLQLPHPVRHISDKSIEQRRMDSLARLLSLDTQYTPCIGVAFYQDELIIASNEIKKISDFELTECLSKKMQLIQEFLSKMINETALEDSADIEHIQWSLQAKLLAKETVLKIIDASNGGVGDILPMNSHRHSKRQDKVEHLKNALLKLAHHCLVGVLTKGRIGFNIQDMITMLSGSITVVVPNNEVMMGYKLHAEQEILYYLRKKPEFNTQISFKKLNIGISKLCCQACHNVLNREEKINYRGTHGMKFPNVFDIDNKNLFEGVNTKLEADLCPSDSESDCDDYVDEEISLEEKSQCTAPSLKSMVGNMYFKPIKPKIASHDNPKIAVDPTI